MNKIYLAVNILACIIGVTQSSVLNEEKIIEVKLDKHHMPGYRQIRQSDTKRHLTGTPGISHEYKLANFYNYQYIGTLFVGSHLQPMRFLFDTGSGWTWVPANIYRSEESRDYRTTEKVTSIHYGMGYVIGNIAVDSFALTQDTGYQARDVNFLSITDMDDMSYLKADGIFGLSPVRKGIEKLKDEHLLVNELFIDGKIEKPMFGLYLDDDDHQSKLTFGSYDKQIVEESKAEFREDIHWMKINTDHHWQVGMYGVKVGTTSQSKYAKNVFFDSGASVNFVTERLYTAIVKYIEKKKGEKCGQGNNNSMLVCPCTSVEDSGFPKLKFKLGEDDTQAKWFTYYPKDYLQETREGGKCEVWIQSHFWPTYWILGAPFLRAFYSVHDYETEKIGLIRVAAATRKRLELVGKNQRCSEERENDPEDSKRFVSCSSMDSCYNFEVYKYDNEKCENPYESCGSFRKASGALLEGCILTKYCDKEGKYKNDDTYFSCPDGVRATPQDQLRTGMTEEEVAEREEEAVEAEQNGTGNVTETEAEEEDVDLVGTCRGNEQNLVSIYYDSALKLMRFEALVDNNNYFAVGFGTQMAGSDMVFFKGYGNGDVFSAKANGYGVPTVDADQAVKDISITQESGRFKFVAYKDLTSSSYADLSKLIWAENIDTPQLVKHTSRGFCLLTEDDGIDQPASCGPNEIWNENEDRCIACGSYTRPSGDKLHCTGEELCTIQQKIDALGYCVDCLPGMAQNPSNKKECIGFHTGLCPAYTKPQYNYQGIFDACAPDECNWRQRVNSDGTCLNCPDYTQASPSGRECISQQCASSQRLTSYGSCEDCQAGYSPSPDGKECVDPNQRTGCNPDRDLDINGVCVPCEDYTRPSYGRSECITLTCSNQERLTKSGYCERCPEHYKSASSGKECVHKCEDNQKISEFGTCFNCPPYQRASSDKTACVAATCRSNQILQFNGLCEDCPEYNTVDSQGRHCLEPVCRSYQFITKSGECKSCPRYTTVSNNKKKCISESCQELQFLNQSGLCEYCPDYMVTNEEFTGCVQPKCGEQEVISRYGKCEACPVNQRPSPSNPTLCLRTLCQDRQIIKSDGTCKSCPDYERAQADGTVCGPDQCSPFQILLLNGSCLDCPTGQNPDFLGKQCVSVQSNCALTQIQMADGSCLDCPPYTKPSSDRLSCVGEYTQCQAWNNRQIKLADGSCFDCPNYQRSQFGGTQCGSDPCNSRQKLLESGNCEFCPDYEKASPSGKECQAGECGARGMVLQDGTCQICPDYQRAQNDGKQCGSDICAQFSQLQIDGTCSGSGTTSGGPQSTGQTPQNLPCGPTAKQLPSGSCERCQDFQRAGGNGFICQSDICNELQILVLDGTCQNCPTGQRAQGKYTCGTEICRPNEILRSDGTCGECPLYFRMSLDRRQCIQDKCNSRQKVLRDGSCEYCDNYSRVDATKTHECSPAACNDRQKLLPDGKCEDCSPYTRRFAQILCRPDACTSRQIILEDGTCQDCPDYTVVTADKLQCYMVQCSNNQFMAIDGVCEFCPRYTTVSRDGRKCEYPKCNANEIILENGSCAKCGDYTRPKNDGFECGSDFCNPGERVQIDGTCSTTSQTTSFCSQNQIAMSNGGCQECPPYTRPSQDKAFCISSQCSSNQKLLTDGSCQYCEPFTKVSTDGISCVQQFCQGNSILMVNGECQQCPPGQQVAGGGYYCETLPNGPRRLSVVQNKLQMNGNLTSSEPKDINQDSDDQVEILNG